MEGCSVLDSANSVVDCPPSLTTEPPQVSRGDHRRLPLTQLPNHTRSLRHSHSPSLGQSLQSVASACPPSVPPVVLQLHRPFLIYINLYQIINALSHTGYYRRKIIRQNLIIAESDKCVVKFEIAKHIVARVAEGVDTLI